MHLSCKDRAFTCASRAPRAAPRSVRLHASAPATAISPDQRSSFKSDPSYTFAPLINGCWQLAGGHGREVFDNIQDKLEAHAAAGFTTYDTADIYGPSEGAPAGHPWDMTVPTDGMTVPLGHAATRDSAPVRRQPEILGQFLRAHSSASGPPVQVFTKYVPNIFQQRPTPAAVEAAIRRSMAKLQVSQLDLVQMHWWEYSVPGMVDAALALADLQSRGLIRFVGTTNMDTAALSAIVDAGVDVAVNQVQFSLLDRRPLNGMLQYCQPRGIKLFTYGSVGGGLLSDKYVQEPRQGSGLFGLMGAGGARYSQVDLNTSSLKMYWNVAKQFGGQELWRELLLVLRGVADKHEVSVANVALRWVMQQGDGRTVFPIVGLRGTSHIADNARALSFSLDAADLGAIQGVLDRATGPRGDCYSFERGN